MGYQIGSTFDNPTLYTFTEEDAAKGVVTFVCDVGSHCEAGMIMNVTVQNHSEDEEILEQQADVVVVATTENTSNTNKIPAVASSDIIPAETNLTIDTESEEDIDAINSLEDEFISIKVPSSALKDENPDDDVNSVDVNEEKKEPVKSAMSEHIAAFSQLVSDDEDESLSSSTGPRGGRNDPSPNLAPTE